MDDPILVLDLLDDSGKGFRFVEFELEGGRFGNELEDEEAAKSCSKAGVGVILNFLVMSDKGSLLLLDIFT